MISERRVLQVPYSAGENHPSVFVPENACDCHHHIYDPLHFPYPDPDVTDPPPAAFDTYQQLQKRLGLTRNVIVTPSVYGTDNACTLDALQRMGRNARAVVVIDPSISDEELIKMDEMGACGIRFFIPPGGTGDPDLIRKLAGRIAPLGWHICFWMSAEMTVMMEEFLRDLPCPIVFDHRGHLPAFEGIHHKAFRIITDFMKEKKAYVKLSALYHDSIKEDYSDTKEVGRAYIKAAPGQVLWGTDWPHPSEHTSERGMPNDADLLDALYEQAGDPETMNKILVDNPARLYHF